MSLEEEMHPTYFALKWLNVDDRLWTDADTARYVAGDHNAVDMWFGREAANSISFAFLRNLPSVRGVSIVGPTRDDLAVFDLDELECLIVVTKCAKSVRLASLTSLRDLRLDARPGLAGVRHLTRLEYLSVSKFRGTDLGFLGSHPGMRGLRLEGRGQRMSLSGLEGCPEVTLLDLWEVNPESLSPIQPLRNLVKLQVKGKKAASSWPAVDIDAVRGMNRLEWLVLLDLGSLRSLIPIRSVPHLKGVKLAGCVIEDGDLSPLVDLPAGVHITPPDDRPHYRPSVQQLMAKKSRLTGRG